jgi:hypothetical protein
VMLEQRRNDSLHRNPQRDNEITLGESREQGLASGPQVPPSDAVVGRSVNQRLRQGPTEAGPLSIRE